jgi:DNA repair photolyase
MSANQLFELRRRTFDTPAFRGIEFIEVEAKSIINKVPGTYLPFNWTINPYRGCSHACTYCADGETPILMADGRTKPLADLEVGDSIYGTIRSGNYRRYVTTEVLAHWSTVKPAYRVVLEDGTELITSADHRFLSDRGWKHVIGAGQGPLQRPHLTLNNKLMGTGRFATPPEHDAEYRRGYLCGMVRGDGNLGTYWYTRRGRLFDEVNRFRLALVDLEAIGRTKLFLEALGVITQEYAFQEAVGTHKAVTAIRTQRREAIASIRRVIEWPDRPSAAWTKGFLAGIFDAEGGHSQGILRISNTDPTIIGRTTDSLRRFGFRVAREETKGTHKRVQVVRLIGGLREKLRFFHTVDPAITRKRTIEGTAIKSPSKLHVRSIEPLGVEMPLYDITTGTGDFITNGVVSHNCFARSTHTYMDMNAGRDFETKIVVKVNAGQLLRKELRAKKWKGEHIAMGTATDPYQRAEGRYKLMPQIIEALSEVGNPFSILTKGTLILRDLGLLTKAAEVTDVSCALSIGTLDEKVWQSSEPGTPHPRKRIEAVKKINDAGIPCGVMVAPILPGISDGIEQLKSVVRASIDAGASHVTPIMLHLRPKVKEVYMDWLAAEYPQLVDRYEAMYARSAYASKGSQDGLRNSVYELIDEAGGVKPAVTDRPNLRRRPQKAKVENEQLSLI